MSYLVVQNLVKRYGGVTAVDGVSYRIEQGSFVSLLGPSGCGKTTTLRCIAGLETPDEGTISVADKVVFSSDANVNVPVHRRKMGVVFQNYALWPHMTVFENVAFPLRVRRYQRTEIARRVHEQLEMLGLQGLERRFPSQLSGGQQQRVALARALVHDSDLLLFDEPLSNLDAKLREQAIFELKKLHKKLGKTIVYVTHNQVEALAMSDVMAVMKEGAIRQMGPPREVYNEPEDQYVATFVGKANAARGRVTTSEDGRVSASVGDVAVEGVAQHDRMFRVGEEVRLFFRPEVTRVHASTEVTGTNAWVAKVDSVAFLGEQTEFELSLGGLAVRAVQLSMSTIREGDLVVISVNPNDVRIVAESQWGEA
ncbi:MAG: ABC transporter ATP-binding protein [Trueperaceae bacterium]